MHLKMWIPLNILQSCWRPTLDCFLECSFSLQRYLHAKVSKQSKILILFTFREVPLSPSSGTGISELCASCWHQRILAAVFLGAFPWPFLASMLRGHTHFSQLPFLFTSSLTLLAQPPRGSCDSQDWGRAERCQWITLQTAVLMPELKYLRTTRSLPMQTDVNLSTQ